MQEFTNSAYYKQQGYLTCGQFAQLCHVKKQTLFHYDDIDLLKPAITDEKGYRFYSYNQYNTYLLIASLKEAGLSLQEIKAFLNNTVQGSRLDILKQAQSTIANKIEILHQVQAALLTEIDRAEEAQTIDDAMIVVQELPNQPLLQSRDLMALSDAELVQEYTIFAAAFEVICAQLDAEQVVAGNYDAYRHVLAHVPSQENSANPAMDASHFSLTSRPAGLYCIAYHRGSNNAISATYQRIFAYCNDHGFSLGQHVYEEYLQNEFTTANEEEYLTRILVQVLQNPC